MNLEKFGHVNTKTIIASSYAHLFKHEYHWMCANLYATKGPLIKHNAKLSNTIEVCKNQKFLDKRYRPQMIIGAHKGSEYDCHVVTYEYFLD